MAKTPAAAGGSAGAAADRPIGAAGAPTAKATDSRSHPAGSSAGKTGTSAGKPTGARSGKAGSASPNKAAPKSRSRKPPPVVLAKPKPWGWIAAALAVVVFAVAAIGYAVLQANEQADLADPSNIDGLETKSITSQEHTDQEVDYEESPPIGGQHNIEWADCAGTLYPIQIRNENAVHSLEHGAVWITYAPELPQDQADTLSGLVQGKNFTMMSPYPGLESPISLQAWGNQLFVDSADDPRIQQFITALRQNPASTPEPGATCDNPTFAQNPVPEEGSNPTDPSAPPTTDPGATTDPAATTDPTATTAP
jgi:hypothetical protein